MLFQREWAKGEKMLEDNKILVAVANYPSEDRKLSLAYVHTRNLYYMNHGLDVTVLNFRADKCYSIDGVPVITLDEYRRQKQSYGILICHAANLKEHYMFLKKYGDCFGQFVFFFHGHEVLMNNHVYPKTYSYIKRRYIGTIFGDIYDFIKLKAWNRYYRKAADKSWFVFVSNWMLDEFLKWTRIPFPIIEKQYMVTYNCIGKPFEDAVYDFKRTKKYDFITIRHNLDNSKYGIDIVNSLAKSNPQYKFLVIGKGEFFNHFPKAVNLEWMDKTLEHRTIVEYLQESRCALMPTRTDAQGLMMCEMASVGIPLITSDIPVCHESLDAFPNVKMISNENTDCDLSVILRGLESGLPYPKVDKYYNARTSEQEAELLRKLLVRNE